MSFIQYTIANMERERERETKEKRKANRQIHRHEARVRVTFISVIKVCNFVSSTLASHVFPVLTI